LKLSFNIKGKFFLFFYFFFKLILIKNREIAGMTADEINRRKGESTADRDARKNEAIRQIKERKAKLAVASGKPVANKQHAKLSKGAKADKKR